MANAKSIKEQRADEQRVLRRGLSLSDYSEEELLGSRTLASTLRSPSTSNGKRVHPYPTLSQLDGERSD